jgi:class 3 adenylate cyclase
MTAHRKSAARSSASDPSAGIDTTVLFADVKNATSGENRGDSAAIQRCMKILREVTEDCDGRVVKTVGDGIMALFRTPDAAAAAAMEMHSRIEAIASAAHGKLAVRVGFHAGPVIERNNDVFGDTVNVASRLREQALNGQVLTSDDTTIQLSPFRQTATRRLYPIQLKGKAQPLTLCELVWRQSPDVTDLAGTFARLHGRARLRVQHGDRAIRLRGHEQAISIGRDGGCDLVIADPKASRQHCTIEQINGRFVLRDKSANGTYVTVADEPEITVHRDDIHLRQHGWIALGQPRAETSEILEFHCE